MGAGYMSVQILSTHMSRFAYLMFCLDIKCPFQQSLAKVLWIFLEIGETNT